MSDLPSKESLAGEINALRNVVTTYLLVESASDDAQAQEMLQAAHDNAKFVLASWGDLRASAGQAFWLYDHIERGG